MAHATEHLSKPYDVADMDPGVARLVCRKRDRIASAGRYVPLTIDAVSTLLTTFFAKERSMTDLDGTEHVITGEPLAYNNWVPYGCCPTGHSMVASKTAQGDKGTGTIMEAFPLDTVTGDFLHEDIRLTADQG